MALTKCPDCGNEISTEAPACPKCGRPNAPAKNRPGTVSSGCGVMIIIIAIVGFIVYFANSADDSSADTTAQTAAAPDTSDVGSSPASNEPHPVHRESRPIQTYTAEQLYAMFHANEIKANRTIGDAVVRFTGTIASIEQSDFSKTPELQIRGQCNIPDDCQDPQAWDTFEADLTSVELSAAARLVRGQVITLQCDKVTMPLEVYAKDCTIVPEHRHAGT